MRGSNNGSMACLLAAKWPKMVHDFVPSNWPNMSWALMPVGGFERKGAGAGAATRSARELHNVDTNSVLR
jgi:hypothetical protein